MQNFNYTPYIKSLIKYMLDNDYTLKPLPKIVLNNKRQKGLFISTGMYSIDDKKVTLFINERHPKDVLRSLAHELIHHKQNIEGKLTKEKCSDKITESDVTIPFEEEAYLQGNMAFRKWTEIYNN